VDALNPHGRPEVKELLGIGLNLARLVAFDDARWIEHSPDPIEEATLFCATCEWCEAHGWDRCEGCPLCWPER